MDAFLGLALTDPATGFPNVPYFHLIQEWEIRRAHRHSGVVCVIRMHVSSGSEAQRRALLVHFRQVFRQSDLVASSGRDTLLMLLTSPDAEHATVVMQRLECVADEVRQHHNDTPLDVEFELLENI